MPGPGAAGEAGPAHAGDRPPVFLIGMMGAGKTTVGRLLAQALGYRFLDCDHELERRAGVSIATIFELEGESGFRAREAALLDELTAQRAVVLATGGGTVLRAENRALLRERGLVVYLEAGVDEILRRTRHDTQRPLLAGADRRARVEALLEERAPLYGATAALRFRSPARNPRRLIQDMLAHPALAALAGPAGARPVAPDGSDAET